MDSIDRQTRREFVHTAAGAVGAVGLAGPATSGAQPSAAEVSWQFFTEEELPLLEAVVEQLIPTDDFPGAVDAGVPVFLDRQLGGHLRRFRRTYRQGLDSMRRECLERLGKPFQDLEWDRQTEFLVSVEEGTTDAQFWTEVSSPAFFRCILEHTMMGYYGDPRHGGNKDGVSFRMIGF